MRQDETREAGALAGTALAEIAELARDVHRGVADRVFGLAGRHAVPVKLVHDGISAIAYGSTRLGVRVVPAAAGAVAAALADPAAQSAHDDPRGRFLLNALNGFWGDRIAEQRPALAPELRVRTHEGRLRRLPENLLHDVRDGATGKLLVFLHGLCENDLSWWLGAERSLGDATATYSSVLRAEQGFTPLYVSFNSGLHISENGRELATLLDTLVREWPVAVDEVVLVGHSMGGLIARSAAHQADAAAFGWRARLTHVVGLGTPHLGAPLERFVNAGTHLLGRLPETRPFAAWLNNRSVGIKDLRYGAVVEDDWFGFDPDERLQDRCTPATLLPGVLYSCVSATLSREPQGWLAHDLLVQHGSAHGIGRARRIPFDPDRSLHIGGRHHFHLLADPLVLDQLRTWLAAPAVAAS